MRAMGSVPFPWARCLRGFPVGELEIVVPVHPVARELTAAGDRVAAVAEGADESLREAGGVAPEPPRPGAHGDRVHPVDTAGVEVVHRELVVRDADAGQRVPYLGMVMVRAPDQEPVAVEPFERGSPMDHCREFRMTAYRRPRADKSPQEFQLGTVSVFLHGNLREDRWHVR